LEFHSSDQAKNWLTNRKFEEQLAVYVRAGLRIFPCVVNEQPTQPIPERIILQTVRQLVTAASKCAYIDSNLTTLNWQASRTPPRGHPCDAIASVSRFASADLNYNPVFDNLFHALANHVFEDEAPRKNLGLFATDAAIVFSEGPRAVFNTPLWPENSCPPAQETQNERLIEQLSTPNLSCWNDWYLGFLDGEPLPWKLQQHIAYQPSTMWDERPESIALEFQKLRDQFDAKSAANELLKRLAQIPDVLDPDAERPMIGHNDPPEEDLLPLTTEAIERLSD